jgi:hypothetical protein
VVVSKNTHHFLELYTNNYWFGKKYIGDKDSNDFIFVVSNIRGRQKTQVKSRDVIKSFDGHLNQEELNEEEKEKLKKDVKDYKMQEGKHLGPNNAAFNLNDSNDSISENPSNNNTGADNQVFGERDYYQNYQQDEQQGENESNKSDQIDEGTMNVFGFNDDLNLDDRVIIQNTAENQIYNLVERPKYLLQFELKDSEQEFLYTISKQEARKTTMYLALLILLNKIVIFGDILQKGEFTVTVQFYAMFVIFIFELILIYQLNNPTLEMIQFWTYMLLLYGIIVLGILLSF